MTRYGEPITITLKCVEVKPYVRAVRKGYGVENIKEMREPHIKIYIIFYDELGWYLTLGYDYEKEKVLYDVPGRFDFAGFGTTVERIIKAFKEFVKSKKGNIVGHSFKVNTIQEWPDLKD